MRFWPQDVAWVAVASWLTNVVIGAASVGFFYLCYRLAKKYLLRL